jgi:hypothetical protein
MQNKANFKKSQMFVTQELTSNCGEKVKMDIWSKQTQTKPILPAILCGGAVWQALPILTNQLINQLTNSPIHYFLLPFAFFFFGLAFLTALQPHVLHIFLPFQIIFIIN